MAEYKFYLKDNNSTSPTPIRLHVHYANMICKLYVGEKIKPEHWTETPPKGVDRKKWEGPKQFKPTKKCPDHDFLDSRLTGIVADAKHVYSRYKDEYQVEPPAPELKRLIRVKLGLEQSEDISFLSYFQEVVEDKLKAAAREDRNKRTTSIPSYELTLSVLKEFQKRKHYPVNWDSINMKFYNRFMDYMIAKGLKANTRGNRIKYLKAVLRKATAAGINNNLAYTDKSFEAPSEKVDSIYLDETELYDLYNLELSDFLSRIRDIFLVSCWTGLRISDVRRIRKENIRGENIHLTTQKTDTGVVVPMHPVVKEILNKYDYRLPFTTDQNMNRELKAIGPILAENTGARVLDKSKYEQIRLHTGRRSFCTNMYNRKKMPVATIMAISGHKTESEFFKYIKTTPDEHAKVLHKEFAKDRELYANGTTLNVR
jgi:integrase